MAHQFYLSIKGTKQGQLKGQQIPHKGKGLASSTPIIAFDFGVQSPFDASSGLPTGKRQHKPFTITMASGTAATQLFQAYCNKEILREVVIEPHQETVVPRISLTNAQMPNYGSSGAGRAPSTGGQNSGSSSSTGPGTPETVVPRVSLTNATMSQLGRFGAGMTPSFGGQGSSKSSNTGNGKPEPVAERITLTNAVISKYTSANGAHGPSKGQGLISIELNYSDIIYSLPKR
jgi:type VI protein secretion system component Hcp